MLSIKHPQARLSLGRCLIACGRAEISLIWGPLSESPVAGAVYVQRGMVEVLDGNVTMQNASATGNGGQVG